MTWRRYQHLLARQMAGVICQQSGLYCRTQVLGRSLGTSWELVEAFPPLTLATQRVVVEGPPPAGRRYPVLLALQSELAQSLVDRLLGGSGRWPAGARTLTQLEVQVLRPLLLRLWEAVSESWPGEETLEYEPAGGPEGPDGRVEFRPSLELRSAREVMARQVATQRWWVASFGVQVASGQGVVWLGFPRELVEHEPRVDTAEPTGGSDAAKVVGELRPHCEAATPVQDPARAKEPEPGDKDDGSGRTVEVSVVLGRVQLRLDELLGLERGDIIRLGHPVDAELPVLVDGMPTWMAQPGTHRGRLAVRLTREHSVPKEVVSA